MPNIRYVKSDFKSEIEAFNSAMSDLTSARSALVARCSKVALIELTSDGRHTLFHSCHKAFTFALALMFYYQASITSTPLQLFAVMS